MNGFQTDSRSSSEKLQPSAAVDEREFVFNENAITVFERVAFPLLEGVGACTDARRRSMERIDDFSSREFRIACATRKADG